MDETYGGVNDYIRLQQLMAELDQEIDAYRRAGCQLAENEAEYRQQLAIMILHERAKGTPVTVISDICRGDESIAQLKLLRDSPTSSTTHPASGLTRSSWTSESSTTR